MKFLVILVLLAGCLDLASASGSANAVRPSIKSWFSKFAFLISKVESPASFRASTVSTPTFDTHRQLRDDLINRLPPVQLEILFSLLTNRNTKIGEYASKRHRKNKHGREPVILIHKSELHLMEQVATKKGYQQLLRERRILYDLNEEINILGINNILNEERSILGVNNIWKINLSAVMPHTAALTDEDFIASADYRSMREPVAWSVMNLIATGHEDVVTSLKNSTPEHSRSIFSKALKRYYLQDDEESLALRFSNDWYSNKIMLQDVYRARTKRKQGDGSLHPYAYNDIRKETEEIAKLEQKIAKMDQIVGKADAIAEFYANESMQHYNTAVENISFDSRWFIKSKARDRITSAEIADLGLYGWLAFREITTLSVHYDNFFELLAQEVEASKDSP